MCVSLKRVLKYYLFADTETVEKEAERGSPPEEEEFLGGLWKHTGVKLRIFSAFGSCAGSPQCISEFSKVFYASGSVLGVLWSPLGPPWGSFSLPPSHRGQPFGSHLAPLGGSLGEARKFDDSGSPLGLALGPLFDEEWELFLSPKLESFLMVF